MIGHLTAWADLAFGEAACSSPLAFLQNFKAELLRERDELWITPHTQVVRQVTLCSNQDVVAFQVSPFCNIAQLLQAERRLCGYGEQVRVKVQGCEVDAQAFLLSAPSGSHYDLEIFRKRQAQHALCEEIHVLWVDATGAQVQVLPPGSFAFRRRHWTLLCNVTLAGMAFLRRLFSLTPGCGVTKSLTSAPLAGARPHLKVCLMRHFRVLLIAL